MATRSLNDVGAEELLAELRAREARATQGLAAKGRAGPLGPYDAQQLAEALRLKQKVVYGVDDRRDAYEITDPALRAQLAAVAALVDVGLLRDNGDGTSTLQTVRFADSHQLCAQEPFRDQPTAPHCSGFLVAPDLLATAGHCVTRNGLARLRIVFGFHMLDSTRARLTVPNGDIYRVRGIVASKREPEGSDFAIVRLDRPAKGHPVLALRRTGRIPERSPVYVVGHPSGLPLKHAGGAVVRVNTAPTHFVANLDTYGGNSGSPVFHADTHEVEGILVRGDTDFVTVGPCRVSNVCPTTGCRGEDVTRATEFAAHVPAAGTPTPP